MPDAPAMNELLGADAPKNWGKWGPDDELGAPELPRRRRRCCAASQHIRTGEVFTLQIRMGRTEGPATRCGRAARPWRRRWRSTSRRWDGEGAPAVPRRPALRRRHRATIFLQGSTQYDALGHVWYDGQLWNGYDARTTVGAMDKASRAADRREGRRRARRADRHGPPPRQAVAGQGRDVRPQRPRGRRGGAGRRRSSRTTSCCIRTGWLKYWYELNDQEKFYDGFNEPGLTYSRELVEWFQQREIPNLVTDTIANEVTTDPRPGVALPLHCALMRNLGVTLTEIAWLDDLADACAEDGRWSFLYVAAPLKVVGGSRRAGQPDRDPLMGDLRRTAVARPLRRGPAADITPEFADALAMFRAGVARNPDGDAIRYFDGRDHLPRARRADRRVRGRAARRRASRRATGWRSTCRTCRSSSSRWSAPGRPAASRSRSTR